MNTQTKSPEEKPSSMATMFVILGVITIFILAVGVWPAWYDSKYPQPVRSKCNPTTKEVQTIIKIDGGVDSIKVETLYGCEYPDGSFIPAPD